MVVLIALVVVLLIPDILGPLGLIAPSLVLAGYLLPGLLEKLIKRAAETLHLLSLYVALLGLLLHAVLDGAGLAGSELRSSTSLAAAIILHRFGMGMMLWLIVQPVFGNRAGMDDAFRHGGGNDSWIRVFRASAAAGWRHRHCSGARRHHRHNHSQPGPPRPCPSP